MPDILKDERVIHTDDLSYASSRPTAVHSFQRLAWVASQRRNVETAPAAIKPTRLRAGLIAAGRNITFNRVNVRSANQECCGIDSRMYRW